MQIIAVNKIFKFDFLCLGMDYASGDRRKSKNDKRAKGRYNKYRVGGKHRSEEKI